MLKFSWPAKRNNCDDPRVTSLYTLRWVGQRPVGIEIYSLNSILQWEETSPTLKDLLSTYLVRPFQMLLDPICLLLTIYTSFVYGKQDMDYYS